MSFEKLVSKFPMVCVGLVIACSSSGNSDAQKTGAQDVSAPMLAPVQTEHVSTGLLTSIDEQRAKLGMLKELGDAPAQESYAQLAAVFEAGRQGEVAFGVYALEPVADAINELLTRAKLLGLGDTRPEARKASDFVTLTSGDWELLFNRVSGAERFVNRESFHAGKGGKDQDNQAYVKLALTHLREKLNAAEKLGVYPYKVRRYFNADADETETQNQELYQVAVAFNGTVDGLPVIGSGSKVAIHMTPDGDFVSHETSLRRVQSQLAIVSGQGLHSPKTARAIVEDRLKKRGVDLSLFRLSRAEFGYYRVSRAGMQSTVAPAYAYFYAPLKDDSKILVETVSAISNHPVSKYLDADIDAEEKRKAALRGGEPDTQ